VRIAGVLTVFAFLILPASISAYYSGRWGIRVIIGLGAGVVATIIGLLLSVSLDLTASPLIILLMGLFLVVSTIIRAVRPPKQARLSRASQAGQDG
jgi:zinc/manganese transport system permease protein